MVDDKKKTLEMLAEKLEVWPKDTNEELHPDGWRWVLAVKDPIGVAVVVFFPQLKVVVLKLYFTGTSTHSACQTLSGNQTGKKQKQKGRFGKKATKRQRVLLLTFQLSTKTSWSGLRTALESLTGDFFSVKKTLLRQSL